MNRVFTIKVHPVYPPIPDRSCDWAAWIDGEEEATTCLGPTASAALAQLAAQIDEAPNRFCNEQTKGAKS